MRERGSGGREGGREGGRGRGEREGGGGMWEGGRIRIINGEPIHPNTEHVSSMLCMITLTGRGCIPSPPTHPIIGPTLDYEFQEA